MRRTHATAIALLLGTAGVAGTLAATRTVHLGAGSAQPTLSERQIAQRSRQLDRFEASLRRSLAQRPPALPPVPRYAASSSAPAVASTPAAAPTAPAAVVTPQIVYRRPAPIVVTVPRAGDASEPDGEREGQSYEADGQSHSDSGEGGDDD